jgi:hypothetical protein
VAAWSAGEGSIHYFPLSRNGRFFNECLRHLFEQYTPALPSERFSRASETVNLRVHIKQRRSIFLGITPFT